MKMTIDSLVRDNIKNMKPYSSARQEFMKGNAETVFLDANENSFGSPLSTNYNRYPDPLQHSLKEKLGKLKGVSAESIFLGNGSDEAIDLLFRIFCKPGKDKVLLFPPTYGMYEVCAAMNDIAIQEVPLLPGFQLDVDGALKAIDRNTKLIFICSPNNPSGNSFQQQDIEKLLDSFKGIVVIDEAYIDYAREKTFAGKLAAYPKLVILQTLSKAWGLAGLRLGMAFACEEIVAYMNKVKYPYNVNEATQRLACEALDKSNGINNWIATIIDQREWLKNELEKLSMVQSVYPSDANFLLVKMKGAGDVYRWLVSKNIIVRDRSSVLLCEDSLRITIGTPSENKQLVENLKRYVS